jgi:hypothetical protein
MDELSAPSSPRLGARLGEPRSCSRRCG